MARKRLPDLTQTDRMYVDRTRGGWLASPGIERHVFPHRRGALAVIAVALLLVALALLAYWRF